MGFALATVLSVLLASHVVLVVGLAREGSWGRAAVAFLVAPLAPWWGWQSGMRPAAIVWTVALALYTLGSSLA